MIKLLELHLTDFRSWKELHLTDLDTKGLWLIQGINGSGKSSIRQAIEYLLIDDTAEGISADDLPRDDSKDCCIKGIFDRDGDRVEITKYRNHRKHKNKIILSINGDNSLTHTDRRVTQKEIEKLLNIDKKTLLVSRIFSQYSSSFAEIHESDRKDILYNILGLNKYATFCDNAKDKCDQIDTEIENKLEQMRRIILNTTELDSEFKEMEQKWETFDKEKKAKIERLKVEKYELMEEDTSEMFERINDLREMLIGVDEKDSKSLVRDIEEYSSEISDLNTNIRILKSKMKDAESNTCPIFKDYCDRLQERFEEAQKEFIPEIETLEKKKNEQELIVETLEFKLKNINDNIQKNKDIVDEVGGLRQRIELKNQLNKGIQDRRTEIGNRIKETLEEENPFLDMMRKITQKIEQKADEIKKLDEDEKSLKDDIQYYRFWKEGFSPKGIPNLKSESFLDALEDETNRVLSETGRGLTVSIGGQSELKSGEVREKISYLINGVNYARFSGGERQRVRIADMFAFGRLISNFDMLILDEVLELSLDLAGIESVLKILKNESTKVGTIAVISHNDAINDKFDNILRVKKIGGISEYE